MKNIYIFMVLVLMFVFIGCNREQAVKHEGVYLFEEIADNVCSFVSVADNLPVLMKCSASKVKGLNKNEAVYLSFEQTPSEATLKSVSAALTRLEMQASWGEGCDFYFPLEDTWRELQCSDTQLDRLASFGKEPLLLVYYAAPKNKGNKNDKFYLAGIKGYKSEFVANLRYIGEDNDSPYICSFNNPKDNSTLLLGCTKTQRAALDRYNKDELLAVKYTDAGEYRLLSYDDGKSTGVAGVFLAENAEPATTEYIDEADDDYEGTFQVHSTTGSFVTEDSSEELCVFDVTGKKLALACSETDYSQLLAMPGRYEIYYTDEDVLFGYEKLY